MVKNSEINFNNHDFLKNIEFADLFQEPDAQLKKQIFNIFDVDKNSEFDFSEINSILNAIDKKNKKGGSDKVITDKEIKDYCITYNNQHPEGKIEFSDLKELLNKLVKYLPMGKTTFDKKINHKSIIMCGIYSFKPGFEIKEKKYNGYIKYDTVIGYNSTKHRALYDEKNDKFIAKNADFGIEVVGIQKYLDTNTMPEIMIKNEKCELVKTIKIDLKDIDLYQEHPYERETFVKDIDANKTQNKKLNVMYSMTNLISSISKLQPQAFSDLVDNVEKIIIKDEKGSIGGTATGSGYKTLGYCEIVTLDASIGITEDTLSHEIGHTVDVNVIGWITDKKKEMLNAFIEEIKTKIKEKNKEENKNINENEFNKRYYILQNEKEFFAEWYNYTINNKKSIKEGTNEVIEYLENNYVEVTCNDERISWNDIKDFFINVRKSSDIDTLAYNQDYNKIFEVAQLYNNTNSAITNEEISQYTIRELRNELNVLNSKGSGPLKRIESLLETEYPTFFENYSSKEIDDKIIDIIELRNIPKIKIELEQAMKKIDKTNSISDPDALRIFAQKNKNNTFQ